MFNYEVKKVKDGNEDKYLILEDGEPIYLINKFLSYKSYGSVNTSKSYAYKLCLYLNYLSSINSNFIIAKNKDVHNFIDYLLFNKDKNTINVKSNVTYSTAVVYLTCIKEFYRYLEDEISNVSILSETKEKDISESFMYGQIWEIDVKKVLHNRISRIKENRDYIKWYTDEQIEAILHNLNTLRDKAIFSLTLEGMRIDEVLSLRLNDYDDLDLIIRTNRTKRSIPRIIPIRESTAELLNNYIYNERNPVEDSLDTIIDDLFINLRKGKNLGKPTTYRNFLLSLKKAAEKAGIDSSKIRTHSGRSTRTMELLDYQAKHPEELTDEQIRQVMGWSNANSIQSYVNTKDERILINIMNKVNKRSDFL